LKNKNRNPTQTGAVKTQTQPKPKIFKKKPNRNPTRPWVEDTDIFYKL
jgi:hypothetical protein